MEKKVVQQLLELNQVFYHQFAEPFADTRSQPQPGFFRLLDFIPRPCHAFLDVGCGEGRFGRFLISQKAISEYVGVDFTPELLERAQQTTGGHCYRRQLAMPGSLAGLGTFDAIACLATLQHIPSKKRRQGLLIEMAQHLNAGGRIFLSNWQFLDNKRQRRKVVDWSAIGLDRDDVEEHDYLMSWRRVGYGLRYVCFLDEAEIVTLAGQAGLMIVSHYRDDGREGDLNLYTVLELASSGA